MKRKSNKASLSACESVAPAARANSPSPFLHRPHHANESVSECFHASKNNTPRNGGEAFSVRVRERRCVSVCLSVCRHAGSKKTAARALRHTHTYTHTHVDISWLRWLVKPRKLGEGGKTGVCVCVCEALALRPLRLLAILPTCLPASHASLPDRHVTTPQHNTTPTRDTS